MPSYINLAASVAEPRVGHLWHAERGVVVGSVFLNPDAGIYLTFDSPAEARALAAACEACAVAMENLPPAEPDPAP